MFGVAAIVDLLYQYWIHTNSWAGSAGSIAGSPRLRIIACITPSMTVCRSQLRRHLHGVGPAVRHLRRRNRTVRLRHARAAEFVGPALGESRDLCRSRAQVRAVRTLVRQGADLVEPPGWRPTGADGKAWSPEHFPVETLVTYDPPATPAARWFATAQLVLAIGAALPLLWYVDAIGQGTLLVCAGAIIVALWLAGAVLQSRVPLRRGLVLQAAVLVLAFAAVTASASTAAPVIRDDAKVQRALERARTSFMAGQKFDRLQVSVLVRDRAGRWRHGAVDGTTPAYPAQRQTCLSRRGGALVRGARRTAGLPRRVCASR
jgi:hypothetical protein